MHIILTITATHDRFVNNTPGSHRQSVTETYHGAKGAALLSQKLSSPILHQDKDPLWASAAMLGISSMTSLEAAGPFEAWPLKPTDKSDLGWLNMTVGKKAIWNATDPFRDDSIFRGMKQTFSQFMEKPPARELHELQDEFVDLCHLRSLSDPQKSPYYYAISTLAGLRYLKCNRASVPFWLKFIGFMEPEFRKLLERKDPRALTLIAHWYAPLCGSVWWIARRAQIECRSICLYLQIYHSRDKRIENLMEGPRQTCGL